MRKFGSKQKTKKIQFKFNAGEARKVSLVGAFNNWDPGADPMKKDSNGTWVKTKMLLPGNIEYKFWVDGQWVQDPENLRVCPNGFGTLNNVAVVV